jgi:Flp pilus assembly protein TadB
MTLWLIAAGALAGFGVFLVAAEAVPAPPRLAAALDRIEGAGPAVTAGRPSVETLLGHWMVTHLAGTGGLVIPRADLALLGRTPEKFLVHKLAAGIAGLASFTVLSAFLAAAGISLPWEVPVAVSLAAGVGMFFFPDYDVRAEASRRRRDFTQAWISYLQLVRLARAAGAATTEALEYAARIGSGWAYARIAQTLEAAARAHEAPWERLAALGEQIGVPEVSDLAETAQIAGSEGTKIGATLAAKTESLRTTMLADSRGQANSRTTTMIVPLTLLGFGFVLLMAFPAFYTLLFST